MTDSYGLFGHPVSHSWSPFIHGMFARQTEQNMVYRLYDSTPDRFRSEVLDFFAADGLGINVTLPHKQAAADLVNELTPRAQQANAVNTIVRDDLTLIGDNTDGTGLVIDLKINLGLEWSQPRILLLGAGGAARGVIGPLLELEPRVIVIANRTAERALTLAAEFTNAGPVSGCQFAEIRDQRFDLIINATSASLRGEVPPIPTSVVGCTHDVLRHGLRRRRDPVHDVGATARCRTLRAGLGHAGRTGRRIVSRLAQRASRDGPGARGPALARTHYS